jgi:methyl-accepting chemotaxis protein
MAVILGIFISRLISKPVRHLNDVAKQLAAGDTDIKKTNYHAKDEVGELLESFRDILGAIQALVTDTNMLTEAAVAGQLSTRADADKHQGDYKKIVEGINNTLDAVIEPVNEASAVLEQMAKGNLGVNVTGDYQGDHAVIKNALNSSIGTISGYIREISDVLGAIAQGNLDVGITTEYKGDFIELKESINGIVVSLNDLLGDITIAAQQVAAGTSQVSDGSQAISQGATEQAASIEELTSTVTEIAAQTRQNAIGAGKANEMSETAKESAVLGNKQMGALQQAMTEINESSANISKIIKVIDDIAFQTNILALNAAVEAARAGIHGKGFAVVAEEVRNLAARSAAAAKETTELIEGSIKKSDTGTKIADDTADALSHIVESVEKAVELVAQISSASNQQASAIGEVNRGIEQMSQVVQTNSATSQEAAAAAEELSGQAVMLKEMVGNFKLKEANTTTHMLISAKKATKGMEKTELIGLSNGEFGKY